MSTKIAGLVAAAVLTATTAACSADGNTNDGGDELTPFPLGVFSGEVYVLDYVAKSQGFFEDHGLDVKFLAPSAGGAAANTFFLGGTLKGWPGNPATIMVDLSKGEDVRIAGWLDTWIPYAVQVPADSDLAKMVDAPFEEKMEALRGQRIGVTGIGALVYQSLVAGLATADVDEDDLTILAVGPPDNGIAQLEAGRLDGYATYSRTDAKVLAERADTVEFVSLSGDEAPDEIRSFSSWALPVMGSLVDDDPDAVEGYVAAQKDAYEWATDNIDAAAQILADEVYNGDYQEFVVEALETLFAEPQPSDFKVTRQAWENEADLLTDLGQIPSSARDTLSYDEVVLPDAQQ